MNLVSVGVILSYLNATEQKSNKVIIIKGDHSASALFTFREEVKIPLCISFAQATVFFTRLEPITISMQLHHSAEIDLKVSTLCFLWLSPSHTFLAGRKKIF